MGVVLKVVAGPRTGLEFRAGERTAITIGRSKTSDFHVLDTSMSRVHAVVARDDAGWYVEDCRSSNGTWVDDSRIDRHRLVEAATFRLGLETVVQFRLVSAADMLGASEVAVVPRCARCGTPVDETLLARGGGGRPFHLACRDLDHLVGTDLGEFRLIETTEALGAGFYFRAHQPSLTRSVTLAVFDAPLVARPGYRDALLAEVRRVSHFLHPHVLQIQDFGEARATSFVVMEHFSGSPLAEVLAVRRFVKIRGAVQVATRTLSALRYAKEQGALFSWLSSHRVLVSTTHDVKLWLFEDPENKGREPRLNEAPYVAPEVTRGSAEKGDERALVYSVAAMLYHMLAGIPPFDGATTDEITRRTLQGRPPALRRINMKVSPALAAAVEASLQRDPSARPESLAAFESQLSRALGGR